MKKVVLCIVVLAGLLWAGIGYAGNMCWTDGWGNYWKVYVTKPDGVSPYKAVTGVWYLPEDFLIPVTGTLQKGLGGTTLRLSLTGTDRTSTDHTVAYFLDATLDPTSKNGTMWYLFKMDTSSEEGSTSFTKTKCSSLPAY